MLFDPENRIVQLCAEGITSRDVSRRHTLIEKAWKEASNDTEKCLSAHYMGRIMAGASDRLNWDNQALDFALNIPENTIATFLPSLYLNIGKDYDELGLRLKACEYYQIAYTKALILDNDPYGKKIKSSIIKAMETLLNNEQ
jgi:rifampin ADP-ribosylating transferase